MQITESKLGAISLILLLSIAAGCSPKDPEAPAMTPPAAVAPAEVSIGDTATPAAPPPGSAPGAPAAAAVPAAIDLAQAERPINAQGNAMNDLEFLNHLVHEVNESRVSNVEIPQKAFKTEAEQMAYEAAMEQRQGPVKDLNELVTAGVLKALPQAPAGQRYAIDAATGKVVLQ